MLVAFAVLLYLVYTYLEFFIDLILSFIIAYLLISLLVAMYFLFVMLTRKYKEAYRNKQTNFFTVMINKVKSFFIQKKYPTHFKASFND